MITYTKKLFNVFSLILIFMALIPHGSYANPEQFFLKPFSAIIPLGEICELASQLRRKELVGKSTGFEWTMAPVDSIIKFIENDFKDFLLPKNVGSYYGQYISCFAFSSRIMDKHNDLFLPAEDFLLPEPSESYTKTIEKYDRRFSRFRNAINTAMGTGAEILFIRVNASAGEADRLVAALGSLYPNLFFKLLVINATSQQEPSTNPRIYTVFHEGAFPGRSDLIPFRLIGGNETWDKILKPIKIYDKPSTQ